MKPTKYFFSTEIIYAMAASSAFVKYCYLIVQRGGHTPLSAEFKDEYGNEFTYSIYSH